MLSNFSQKKVGIFCAFGAFFLWGIFPIYFKNVHNIGAFELLACRIFFSTVLLFLLLIYTKSLKKIINVLKDKKTLFLLIISSILIALNWLTYILAVFANNIAEASLGYFINPLVSIFFGIVFLKEKADLAQKVAIFIMFVAILQEIYFLGRFPFTSMTLALTFGIYGLIKKFAKTDSLVGIFIETALLSPVAIFYLAFYANHLFFDFFVDVKESLLIMLSGPITVVPLILFSNAAARINLGTIGYIQYLSPFLALFLALFIYNESISSTRIVTFVLIWISLMIVTANSFLNAKRR